MLWWCGIRGNRSSVPSIPAGRFPVAAADTVDCVPFPAWIAADDSRYCPVGVNARSRAAIPPGDGRRVPPDPWKVRMSATVPPPENDLVATLRVAGCVFAEDEAGLLTEAASSPEHLRYMVSRRTAGDPLETILGWAEFCGLRIAVEPGVFVPRRRTEILVREALALVPAKHLPVLLDLCCGTGALGVAVAAGCGPVELVAVDVDPTAVRCAARNLLPSGGRARCGDLYEPVPASLRGRVDLLLANAPYVPTAAIAGMPPEARLHEPRVALDGGTDGLDVQRRAIDRAPAWLAPGGSILVETSRDQADRTLAMMRTAGLAARLILDDELDGTVAVGTTTVDS